MDYNFPKGPFLEPETFKIFTVFIVNNYPPFTNGWRELFSLKNTKTGTGMKQGKETNKKQTTQMKALVLEQLEKT